jgi:signal transduction histidine kinase
MVHQQIALPEEELTRKAEAIRLLAKGLFVTVAIGEIIVIVLWLLNLLQPVIPLTIVSVSVMLVSSVTYWLVRAGKVKAAGYFFVVSLLLESTIITPLFGGFTGPMAITYLFSILVAGMVISLNAGFFIATLAAVFYLATIGLEQAGLLPQLIKEGDKGIVIPYLTVVIRLAFFYLVAFLSWFAASRLNQALQGTRRYAAELQTANEKLRASEEELRASNEELRATEEELRTSNEELETANTELKEAQEQLIRSERLAAIGQLAGGVGHELRNPLGAIKNAVYYIKGKVTKSELAEKEPRVMQFLDIVDDEISASNKIINDLLSFSRVGKPAVSPTRVEKIIEGALSRIAIPENIEVTKRLKTELNEIEVDSCNYQRDAGYA